MESIIQRYQYKDICFICGRKATEKHHVEGKFNRDRAERQGLFIYLCPDCHNSSKNSVHMNGKIKTLSHIAGQYAWMFNYLVEKCELPFDDFQSEAIEAYRKEYGKSHI